MSQQGVPMQSNISDGVVGLPEVNDTLLRSAVDPLVSVAPNATDVFFVTASALMGVVFNGCGASRPLHREILEELCLPSLGQPAMSLLLS